MIQTLVTLILVLCSVAICVEVLWLLCRYSPAGAGLVMIVCVIEAVFGPLPGLSVGVSIYPADAVTAMLLGAAVLRLAYARNEQWRDQLLLLALLMLFAYSLLRGAHTYDVARAGVEARGTFYLLGAALYFATTTKSESAYRANVRLWLLGCVALWILAVARWAGFNAGSQLENDYRVLGAANGLVLAVGFFISLYFGLTRQGSWWERQLFYILAPLLIVLQHRTVWIASLVALVWWTCRYGRIRTGSERRALGAAWAAMLVFILAASVTSEDLAGALRASATNKQTWDWRVESWRQLLEAQSGDAVSYLFGSPFGGGYERYIDGQVVNVSPHNAYVQFFLRMGVVGLGLFVLLYVRLLPSSGRTEVTNAGLAHGRVYDAVLVLQLVYCVTYSLSYPEGMWIGMASAMTLRRSGVVRKVSARRGCVSQPL